MWHLPNLPGERSVNGPARLRRPENGLQRVSQSGGRLLFEDRPGGGVRHAPALHGPTPPTAWDASTG